MFTSAAHIHHERAPRPRPRPRTRTRHGRITLAETPELYMREEMG